MQEEQPLPQSPERSSANRFRSAGASVERRTQNRHRVPEGIVQDAGRARPRGPFRVLILQVQEFENERVSDVSVSRQAFVIGRRGGPCAAGSLVGETGDLSIELAGRPATRNASRS